MAERRKGPGEYVLRLLGWDAVRLARQDYDGILTHATAKVFLQAPALRPLIAFQMGLVGNKQLENARRRLDRAELRAIVRTLGVLAAAGAPLAVWIAGQLR